MIRLPFLALFFYIFRFSSAQTACLWNINTDLPPNDPLYMSNGQLINPTTAGLPLSYMGSMRAVCAGKGNTFSTKVFQETDVKCVGNNQISYSGSTVPLSGAACTSPIQSDLIFTGTSCATGRGEIMNIGFNTSTGIVSMLNVCYDRVFDSVFYSKNKIYASIAGSEKDPNRPSFRTTGVTSTTAVSNAYTQANQLILFTSLLGSSQANKLLNSTSYLARGHLAPDADYMFGSWSTATYFLVNAAPEWQDVNAGNWLRVENLARDTATRRNEDIVVYTGIHDVLQLPNSSGTLVNMYLLSGNRLKVPKFYWKILYSESTLQGIAFVTLNNPHAKTISPSDLICRDICSENLWSKPEWKLMNKGYTYCCNVNELLIAIGSMPLIPISGVMKGA